MDIIVSKSTMILSKPPISPVRTYSHISLSSKNLFFSNNGFRSHRTHLGGSGSRFSSAVRKLSVTCANGIREINETQFSDSVLKSDRPVLVEFVANWCGPCRLISPAMEWVAQVPALSHFQAFWIVFMEFLGIGFLNLCSYRLVLNEILC